MKGSDAAERERDREAFRTNGNKCREKKDGETRGRDGRTRAGLSMEREREESKKRNKLQTSPTSSCRTNTNAAATVIIKCSNHLLTSTSVGID